MNSTRDIIKATGQNALVIAFCLLLTSVVLFFLNFSISPLNFILANILAFLITFWLLKDIKKTALIHSVNLTVICLLALYFSHSMDFSFDSLWYHIPAIKALKDGANPLVLNTAYSFSHNWINFFPKGSWIINASLASFFNCFECAKLYNVFLIYASFLFIYPIFKENLKEKPAFCAIFAAIVALNPISTAQSHTFLVDGALSSLIIIFICTLFNYVKNPCNKNFFLIFAALTLVVNTKFTGVAYAFVFLAGTLYFLKTAKERLMFLLSSAAISAVAVFIIGFNPYSVNLLEHKNPVYPIGSELEIVTYSIPPNMRDMNRFEKFTASIFSEYSGANEISKLKMPFTITKKDVKLSHLNQLYTSGFGMLFSGVFLLSLVILVLLARHLDKNCKALLFSVFVLFISIFINPECWWARFVPQVALLPVFIIFFALQENKKAAAYSLFAVLFLNTLITSSFYYVKTLGGQVKQQLILKTLKDKKLYIEANDPRASGIKIRLDELGLDYVMTEEPDCDIKNVLKFSTISLCSKK